MPWYEYRCDACGFEFDALRRISDPNPPCPNPQVFRSPDWNQALIQWQQDFERGRPTPYPGDRNRKFGPETPHTVIHLEGTDETRTLAEWVAKAQPCGCATQKLVSRSSFHLNGSGWAKDGY